MYLGLAVALATWYNHFTKNKGDVVYVERQEDEHINYNFYCNCYNHKYYMSFLYGK